jgi:hypothetical protein
VSESPTRPTVYEMVIDGEGDTVVSRICYRIADEAASDPAWRAVYDSVIDSGLPYPETVVFWGRPPLEPGVALVASGDSPTQRAGMLWSRLIELGIQPDNTADSNVDSDTVAAVVAAELWLAALAAPNLNGAASYGCDAVNSLAAILARSIGEPASSWAPLAAADGLAGQAAVEQAIRRCRAWVERVLGVDAWGEIRDLAAGDLAYQAKGGSLTYQAAQLLAGS